MKKINLNFRGIKKVIMVETLEGEGKVEEGPIRIVRYFFTLEELNYLGKVDTYSQEKVEAYSQEKDE